jgi:DNA-binding XRE family transcriptional regulator
MDHIQQEVDMNAPQETLTTFLARPDAEIRIKRRMVAMALASEIETVLRERQMSQADLAALMGASRQWISQILGGSHGMGLGTAVKVADALGLDVVAHLVDRHTLLPVSSFPSVSPAAKERGRCAAPMTTEEANAS